MGFYFLYPLLFLVSILPFSLLYMFSNLLFYIIYYIVGYRKKIVRQNLINSFPNKSETELKTIERKYYLHLCDLILETIKGWNISKTELQKRIKNVDVNVYNQYFKENKHCMVIMSHNANWEWVCLTADISVQQKAMCIYKKLSNKNFDKWIYSIRSRFGTLPISMENSLRIMKKETQIPTATAFIADQNPSSVKQNVWVNFLNQPTVFLNGPARIAQKLNYDLLYLQINKIKRGYYECTTEVLATNVNNDSIEELTQKIASRIEKDILQQPHTWLWSHRRWKHKKEN